jgi:hypothetical protein
MLATLTGDRATLERLTIDHEDRERLWAKGYPEGVAELLANQYRDMAVFRTAAPSNIVYLGSEALPLPLAVVREDSSWRVDADPLIRMWARH